MRNRGAQLPLSSATEVLADRGVPGNVRRSLPTLSGNLVAAEEQGGVQKGPEATSQRHVCAVHLS